MAVLSAATLSSRRRHKPVADVLPSWVPALGTVADVGLNTINDVRGASVAKGTTQAWCGLAYAPWYGALGSLVNTGGGHSDGRDNDIYRYDIDSRLHSKIKNRATSYLVNNYTADTVTGWMWADATGTIVQEGEPFADHTYANLVAVPPSALAGAANGWLFKPGGTGMPEGGSAGTDQPIKLALGAALWSFHGTPMGRGPAHGAAIYDPVRNRVVMFNESQEAAVSSHPYVDFATGTTGSITTGAAVRAHYYVAAYHAGAACYMLARFASPTLIVIDANTNAVYTPTIAGTAPAETAEGAWDFVDDWNAWVYYPGTGGNNIYTLKCDGNPRTGTWTWAMQTVTGTARAVTAGGGGIPYNRMRLCLGLGVSNGVVLWHAKYTEPVQAFRISPP